MPPADRVPDASKTSPQQLLGHIGCVSFLNSKPLIDPLLKNPDVHIHFAVPSALQQLIESRTVSTALLSVVDYHTTRANLYFVPAGMIGCDGPTLTVRIFSRVPARQIRTIHGDTDSHTSVLLARLILLERYRVAAPLVPFRAKEGVHPGLGEGGGEGQIALPETMLLIGDKVVNAAPGERDYPYQLDLGEEWKALTGLPFVFAMWMMRKDVVAQAPAAAQQVAGKLAEARRRGAGLTELLLDRYATEKQWPRALARKYFTQYLRYEVTPRAREGLVRFFEMAGRHKLLPNQRPIEYLELRA